MNPNKTFNMHEINRLLLREQIPGFKMLPKEEKYLAEYRKALMEYHNYTEKDKNEEAQRDQADREAKIEARKAAIRAKKNKKHAIESEQPASEEIVEPTRPEEPSEPIEEITMTEE